MKDNQQVGQVLTSLRKNRHVNQDILCMGLCTTSSFSRYERGERIPDRLLLKTLVQRLGGSAEYIVTAISDPEYTYLCWKRDVLIAAEESGEKGIRRLRELLESPKKFKTVSSCALQDQFFYSMQSFLLGADGNYPEGIRLLDAAVKQTAPGYGEGMEGLLLSAEEIMMTVRLSELYLKNGERSAAEKLLREIIRYSEKHYRWGVLLDVYPAAARLLAPILLEEGDFLKCERICGRAIEMLLCSGSARALKELLDCYLRCGSENAYTVKYRRWLWALEGADEAYGGAGGGIYHWEQEIYLISEIIRSYRSTRGLSQEEMSSDLFSARTASSLERGKHALHQNNYRAVREKLSIKEDYFNPMLNTGDYDTLEKMQQVIRACTVHHYDKALGCLKEVEERLEKSGEIRDTYNRKRLEIYRTMIGFSLGRITGEQLIAASVKNLECCYEDIYEETFWNCFLSNDRADCLNYIAISIAKKDADRAIYIWEHILEKLEKSRVGLGDRYGAAMTAICNLTTRYGITGRFRECIDTCDKGIRLCFQTGRFTKLGHLIGDRTEAVICLGGEKESCRDAFRQAYYLCDMFAVSNSVGYYDRFYRENYDPNVEWY